MSSPRDYHNPDAEDGPGMGTPNMSVLVVPTSVLPSPVVLPPVVDHGVDVGHLELVAFEKGRMQGEMEAARRIDEEAAPANKTFEETTTVMNPATQRTDDTVEINQLSGTQWLFAMFGEVLAAGYIVLMAVWIDQYRVGGADWSNTDQNGNRGMFNVHVFMSFIGLWFMSQAYITYRLLPATTHPLLNKGLYIVCHLAALFCFAIAVSAATISQPATRAWSMHAWTAYLGIFVYLCHVVYSCGKLLFGQGVSTNNWNEGPRVPEEQGLVDGQQRQRLYHAGPGGVWQHRDQEAALDLDSRNANNGMANPVWSELASHPAGYYFLVPRARIAVCCMVAMMVSVLIGLGEWQLLLSVGHLNWASEAPDPNRAIRFRGDEAIIIGVIGLITLAGTLVLAYSAMPPRTTLIKGMAAQPASAVLVRDRRASISMGSTVPNTRIEHEEMHAVEVV